MQEPFPSASPPIVDIRRLTRRFGATTALDDVSLTVPRGGVFGLIGGNGAGKTTLIKHLLGMLKAQSGTVQVFGLDPVQNPVGTLGRIGYLSEDRDLPPRLDRLADRLVRGRRLGRSQRHGGARLVSAPRSTASRLRAGRRPFGAGRRAVGNRSLGRRLEQEQVKAVEIVEGRLLGFTACWRSRFNRRRKRH